MFTFGISIGSRCSVSRMLTLTSSNIVDRRLVWWAVRGLVVVGVSRRFLQCCWRVYHLCDYVTVFFVTFLFKYTSLLVLNHARVNPTFSQQMDSCTGKRFARLKLKTVKATDPRTSAPWSTIHDLAFKLATVPFTMFWKFQLYLWLGIALGYELSIIPLETLCTDNVFYERFWCIMLTNICLWCNDVKGHLQSMSWISRIPTGK